MTDDTDDADDQNDSAGQADVPTDAVDDAPRTHEYVWRCTGCKARYDERPDRCEHCGATEFTKFRDL
ncbi:hypothetical protein L593_14280 [Salinarchaeum sp. Harcht-Bsk1]|uniref:hypothetical protein n=1 Tax=Salinarchaeum sp. Harcht-Bsk1 TaxID=1333523 RepID=UPI0003424100|nr:hypothetical protein [Salinarchaeum sp. Harcht-Bsk1]AGN02795.1 hypothetical protein L593_14280 [Salinarchaeum sp. Harcht-Bsk1]